jgi:serine/threonine protein kinase
MALAAGKPLSGRVIEGYEVIDVLHSLPGRIAYRVKNLDLGRFEQMEILPQTLAEDDERSERFLREIRLLSSLEHPNIVTCYGAARLEGQLAMMVEMLEGVTLAERLELGPMEPAEALSVMKQLLGAVDAIHAQEVIHREISPVNIIVTPDKVIKLSGFTFAKTAHDFGLTRVGTIVGDLDYSSPEQISGDQALDARTDVYALGAVFFALLTGRPPFEGKSQFDVMLAHMERAPKPPSEVRPGVPPEFDEVVLRALAKKPEGRYASAGPFLKAIEGLEAAKASAALLAPGSASPVTDSEDRPSCVSEEILEAEAAPPSPKAQGLNLPPSTYSSRFAWAFVCVMLALIVFLAGLAISAKN